MKKLIIPLLVMLASLSVRAGVPYIVTQGGFGTNAYLEKAFITNSPAILVTNLTAIAVQSLGYADSTLFFDGTRIFDSVGGGASIDPSGRGLQEVSGGLSVLWDSHQLLGGTWTVSSNLTLSASGMFSAPSAQLDSQVVSNKATIDMGLTNYFSLRSSNSAALPPDFNLGTNGTAYFRNFPQVAGKAMGNLSTSNAPLTGTGIAGVVQTNNFTFVVGEGGRYAALTVSNDNRALPDTTNYFVIQDTNSSAIAKDLAVGTNHNVYVGSGLTVGTAGNLLQGIQRGVAILQSGTNRVSATFASVTNPILATPIYRDATNFWVGISNIVEGTSFDIVAMTNAASGTIRIITTNTVSWVIVK